MGGTPAGAHGLDPRVLSPSFVYATATPAEKARFEEVMDAADDIATAIGVILAHEVGHSIGLVARGPASGGLFGDDSLHNDSYGTGQVMNAVIGYESVTSLEYRFRPTNLAYLRERILLAPR
ncbi:MAG: hypothetical protein ACE5F1_01665 [Planctomycetota bacterium]